MTEASSKENLSLKNFFCKEVFQKDVILTQAYVLPNMSALHGLERKLFSAKIVWPCKVGPGYPGSFLRKNLGQDWII